MERPMTNPTDKRRGGGGVGKPVVLIHKLHSNFGKSVNKKNISWPEYFSFYRVTTPLSINYSVSVKGRLRTADCRPGVKCRLRVCSIGKSGFRF